MSKKEEKRMTLEEYEQKYSRRENTKTIRLFAFILTAAIGIIVITCLLIIVLKIFEINEITGYVSIGVAAIVFIALYLYPIIKIARTDSFITNVNSYNVKHAQRHNRALREKISDKIIEITATTKGVGWYKDELVGKLAVARHSRNDAELKKVLTELYEKDVKKTANKIIRDSSFKVGITTALSQSQTLDTMFIVVYELNLIKQLVFLYGFRPSDSQLMKIYFAVIRNALIAYGAQSAAESMTAGIVQKIGGIVNSIPLLGTAISTVIGSTAQGVINASLTVVIGFQTKKYLKREYRLQDILDNITIDDEEEKEMLEEIKSDVMKKTKKIKEDSVKEE